jgi:hypothetical protein
MIYVILELLILFYKNSRAMAFCWRPLIGFLAPSDAPGLLAIAVLALLVAPVGSERHSSLSRLPGQDEESP